MPSPSRPHGFVAITSLLIVAAIAMFFAIGMLLDGVSNASLSMNSVYYEHSRTNMLSCLEDALLRIRKEETFNRPLNYSFPDDNSCSATIQWFAPQQVATGRVERIAHLDVTGTSGGFTRAFRYELKIARHDVNYSDGSLEHMNTIDFVSVSELSN